MVAHLINLGMTNWQWAKGWFKIWWHSVLTHSENWDNFTGIWKICCNYRKLTFHHIVWKCLIARGSEGLFCWCFPQRKYFSFSYNSTCFHRLQLLWTFHSCWREWTMLLLICETVNYNQDHMRYRCSLGTVFLVWSRKNITCGYSIVWWRS